MRVIIGFLLLLFCFQVQAQQVGYDIKLTVEGIKDKELMLGVHYGSKQYLLDTAQVVGNTAQFKNEEDTLKNGVYFIYSPDFHVEFVVHDEPVNFRFKTKKEGSVENLRVFGSTENQLFANYQRFIQTQTEAQKALGEGKEKANEALKEQLEKQMKRLSEGVKAHQDSIVRNYSKTMLAKMILMSRPNEVPSNITDQAKKYEYAHQHYFDGIDLSDEALIRTPLFESKVVDYLDKYTVRQPDSVMKAVDQVVLMTKDNQENKRHLMIILLNKYANTKFMGMEQVFVDYAEKYFLSGRSPWMAQETIANIRKNVKALKPNLIGQKAPEIHVLDTSLNEPVYMEFISEPDYLVLYFYDPDCGFCKKQTPILVNNYESIRDLNAEVFAVVTITDTKRWKDYIKEMDMQWINGADPYGRSPFRETYYIKSTPMIYILDRNREIIARRIGAEQVKDFIEFHSKKKKEENRQ